MTAPGGAETGQPATDPLSPVTEFHWSDRANADESASCLAEAGYPAVVKVLRFTGTPEHPGGEGRLRTGGGLVSRVIKGGHLRNEL